MTNANVLTARNYYMTVNRKRRNKKQRKVKQSQWK